MDKIVTLADTATPETAQAVRLQVDTRKWIAGKMLPKKYGDKASEVTVNSTVNNVLVMSQDQVRKLQQRHQEALSR